MTTALDKLLKRQVTVDGVDYTLAFDPKGMRLTGKGKRKPEVDLRWVDLLNGEAALTMALNASLSTRHGPLPNQRRNASPDRTRNPERKKV